MDWKSPTFSKSVEEREVEAEFATRMRKRAASAQGEATLDSKGPNGKRFKQYGVVEEVQISPKVIFLDALEQAPGALPTLEGDALGVSWEACALLEDRALVRETPLDDELHGEEVGGPSPRATPPSLVLFEARRTRPLDKLILSSYVKPLECSHPVAGASAPYQEAARLLVRKCNPCDMRDSSVAHIRNLYPHIFRFPVVARSKEYFIPFPNYLDKGSYQRVAKEVMYIRNHNFNETAKLVWSDL